MLTLLYLMVYFLNNPIILLLLFTFNHRFHYCRSLIIDSRFRNRKLSQASLFYLFLPVFMVQWLVRRSTVIGSYKSNKTEQYPRNWYWDENRRHGFESQVDTKRHDYFSDRCRWHVKLLDWRYIGKEGSRTRFPRQPCWIYLPKAQF